MKRIALLGSTGSIGTSTLEVVKHLCDQIEVVSLAAHSNVSLIKKQIQTVHPKKVALFDPKAAKQLKDDLPDMEVVCGREGLIDLVTDSEVDFVLVGMLGIEALAPTVAAIKAGKSVGLANKEILVAAGELLMGLAKEYGVTLIPIDSEHSALFQCLVGEPIESVRRLILTASGGPFRKKSMDELRQVTVDDALAHPTWKMGAKITVDSSTLMNKGFELIEAAFLFGMPCEKMDVVIHPQSIVHSLVEFQDGAIKGQMSQPNMMLPIQYALTYPDRVVSPLPPFDFTKSHTLEFFPPDTHKFPALKLAYRALDEKGSLPCYLNAANEVFVSQFLERKISWATIVQNLQTLIDNHTCQKLNSVDDILAADHEARKEALAL